MIVRALEPRDLPILEAIYNEQDLRFSSGFPDFLRLESAFVVVDSEDRPIMACGAKLIPELIMICDQRPHMAVRLEGIGLLHKRVRNVLNRQGFTETVSFVCPRFPTFARTMERRFGWVKTWTAYKVV
jgi:hypothetical protein